MPSSIFHEESIEWCQLGVHCGDPFWIFRGQRKAEWGLETSLERACRALSKNLDRANEVEESILREFRRRFHHYSSHMPGPSEYLQWYSLMQHYGAPTRLLDFTYSRHVAAYFALEEVTEDDKECAIWAINSTWVNKQAVEIYRRNSKDPGFLSRPADDVLERSFAGEVLRRPHQTAVIAINPFQLDERLTIQKGVFLCPGDVTRSFADNLKSLDGHDSKDNVRKFKIHASERVKLLRELYQINISRATLFPGLDGFAQSLRVYHPDALS